ncbi:MAG TPA: hypothetical protein VI670_00135 [Thermoanaerobaculia bacterium]|jgi:hypothetical protein
MATSNLPDDVFKRLQDLGSRAVAQQQRVIERLTNISQQFLKRAPTADLDPAKAVQFWVKEVGEFVQGVTEANLSYYSAVTSLGEGFLQRLADASFKPAPAKPLEALSSTKPSSSKGTRRRRAAKKAAAKARRA